MKATVTQTNIETYWTVPDDSVLPLRVTVERPPKGATIYRLHRPEGPVVTFNSARKLLIDLTGHPQARHWTFDRYFKQGKHSGPSEPSETVLDLLGWTDPPKADKSLTGAVAATTGLSPAISGVDLVNRYDEVAKLLFAGFGTLIYRSGYDPDDVLQEVYKGLLVRNNGSCAFDPRKASFGHYVHMVCSCVLANYHRKMCRRRIMEQVGSREYHDGSFVEVDVADSNIVSDTASDNLHAVVGDLVLYIGNQPVGQSPDGKLAMMILPLHAEGMTRGEIADRIGKSKALVSRALSIIRQEALNWSQQRCP